MLTEMPDHRQLIYLKISVKNRNSVFEMSIYKIKPLPDEGLGAGDRMADEPWEANQYYYY